AVWFWKMGALALGAVLLFVAVIGAGVTGSSRGVLPAWLGLGGAVFGGIGVLVYVFDFWGSTVTGAAINPMRSQVVRFGIGLRLQVWMVAVGATLLRDFRERASVLPPQMRTPVPRREAGAVAVGGAPHASHGGGAAAGGAAAGGPGAAAAGGMRGAPEPP